MMTDFVPIVAACEVLSALVARWVANPSLYVEILVICHNLSSTFVNIVPCILWRKKTLLPLPILYSLHLFRYFLLQILLDIFVCHYIAKRFHTHLYIPSAHRNYLLNFGCLLKITVSYVIIVNIHYFVVHVNEKIRK